MSIKPALTAEEWERHLRHQCEVEVPGRMNAMGESEEEAAAAFVREAAVNLASAAYFTWDLVDAIRECAEMADAEYGGPAVYDTGPRIPAAIKAMEAADRIAALLPPREP